MVRGGEVRLNCDCFGTSDSTLVPLNPGQGSAADDGLPVPAKLAQSVRILAASACWPGLSTTGMFGRSNRYGTSARRRLAQTESRAASSLNRQA